jgi:hypothetical protein
MRRIDWYFVFLMGVLAWAVLFPAFLFAQPTDVGTLSDGQPSPMPGSEWFANAASISAATVFLVSAIKRGAGTAPIFSQIPTWLYAIVISMGLTLIARNVFGTLQGPLWEVLITGAIAAATASGAREWVTSGNFSKTLGQSLRTSKLRRGIE